MSYDNKNEFKTLYYDLFDCICTIENSYFEDDINDYDLSQLLLDSKIYVFAKKLLNLLRKKERTDKENKFIEKILKLYNNEKDKEEKKSGETFYIYFFFYDYMNDIFEDMFNCYFDKLEGLV